MYSPRFSPHRRDAFTLIELLVVIVIIGVLTGIALPVFNQVTTKSNQTKTLSNMKQVGASFLLYAQDTNNTLPALNAGNWPALVSTYVGNLQVYNSPIPGYAAGKPPQVTDPTLLASTTANYTDYIANGYNDLGTTPVPRLSLVSQPTQVIMLAILAPTVPRNSTASYVNVANTGAVGKTTWTVGSVYVFCDGSARMLLYNPAAAPASTPSSGASYTDWLWLTNKPAAANQ